MRSVAMSLVALTMFSYCSSLSGAPKGEGVRGKVEDRGV